MQPDKDRKGGYGAGWGEASLLITNSIGKYGLTDKADLPYQTVCTRFEAI
jgi:hypothetical protein